MESTGVIKGWCYVMPRERLYCLSTGWIIEEVLLQNDDTTLKSHALCKDLRVDWMDLSVLMLKDTLSHTSNRLIFCRSTTAANPFMFALCSICQMLPCFLSLKQSLFVNMTALRLFAFKTYVLQGRFTAKTRLTCLRVDHAGGK